MWIFNACGFYSVVVKPGDEAEGMVTVRARVRGDLEALQERYLPELGPIVGSGGTDYPFRARVARVDFAAALQRAAMDFHYDNFKSAIFAQQGPNRARVYGKIWRDLIELEDEPRVDLTGQFSPRMAWRLAKTVQVFKQQHGHWPTRIEMPKGYYNLLLLDIGQLWHQPMLQKLTFSRIDQGLRALDEAGLVTDYDRDVSPAVDHREAFIWMFG